MELDSLTIKGGMEGERRRKEKMHERRGVNNSDTEAPLSGVDGVIFNKAYTWVPKTSGHR